MSYGLVCMKEIFIFIGGSLAFLLMIIGFANHLIKYYEYKLNYQRVFLGIVGICGIILAISAVAVMWYDVLSKTEQNTIDLRDIKTLKSQNIVVDNREVNKKIESLDSDTKVKLGNLEDNIEKIKTSSAKSQEEMVRKIEKLETQLTIIKDAQTSQKEWNKQIDNIEHEIKELKTLKKVDNTNNSQVQEAGSKPKTTKGTPRKASEGAEQIEASCGPSNAEGLFVVSLSKANLSWQRAGATLTIVNTTSEPLFLAINDLSKPILFDVDGGFSLQVVGSDGIKWLHATGTGGPDNRDEKNYNRIGPNQRLTCGLSFSTDPKITLGPRISLTMDFVCLTEGKVMTVSASPCLSMASPLSSPKYTGDQKSKVPQLSLPGAARVPR